MRAAVLPGLDQDLEIRDDVEVMAPEPEQVRIRVAASGVCHSDISLQNGGLPHPLPCVPGHEGAGEVIEVGDAVTGLSVGDHVIIAWVPSCGDCAFCLGGQPNLCEAHMTTAVGTPGFTVGGDPMFGYAGTGTFAEEVVVRQESAIPIPKDIPFDVASLIGCGVMTGAGAALNTAKVQPGTSVAVFGCGGVGISIIQGARIAGAADIAAFDVVEAKLDMAKRFGATHTGAPSDVGALSQELTEGRGFDYAFEAVGVPDTIRAAWDATRRGGTTVVVGAGRLDAMAMFSAFELFYMERTLKGCWYGSANVKRDFPRLLKYWRRGQLDLEGMITKRFDLKDVNEALATMQRGEVVRSIIEFPST